MFVSIGRPPIADIVCAAERELANAVLVGIEAGILPMPDVTADGSVDYEEKGKNIGGLSFCGSLVGNILSGTMFYGGDL